jgi:hypothetical protein
MVNQFDVNYNIIKENTLKLLTNNDISLTKASKQLGLDRSTVTKWAKEAGLPIAINGGAKKINEASFSNIDSEDSAYWLGFLYADGWVMESNSVGLSLQKGDIGHIQKYKKFLKYEGTIYESPNAYSLQFRNKIIGNNLKKLGCIPNKSLKLTFPNKELVDTVYIRHFIRGYFDGDGSITNPIKSPFGCNLLGTYDMLYNILNHLNIDIAYIKKNKNIYSFNIWGDNSRKFLSYIYDNCNVYLDRKYDRYKKHLVKYSLRKNYL